MARRMNLSVELARGIRWGIFWENSAAVLDFQLGFKGRLGY